MLTRSTAPWSVSNLEHRPMCWSDARLTAYPIVYCGRKK